MHQLGQQKVVPSRGAGQRQGLTEVLMPGVGCRPCMRRWAVAEDDFVRVGQPERKNERAKEVCVCTRAGTLTPICIIGIILFTACQYILIKSTIIGSRFHEVDSSGVIQSFLSI